VALDHASIHPGSFVDLDVLMRGRSCGLHPILAGSYLMPRLGIDLVSDLSRLTVQAREIATGRNVSGRCQDILFSARFPGNRIGYMFAAEDGAKVAFAWHSRPNEADGPDIGAAPVDRVAFLVFREVEQIEAEGLCQTGLAANGETTVLCEAKTPKGRFAAQFQTDRQPPRTLVAPPEPAR
jgi:hypothetical protein